MMFNRLDRALAHKLPSEKLKDLYPRGMRRLAEMGFMSGNSIRKTKHGFSMIVNRVDAIKWYVHYFGEFEPLISKAFKAVLPNGGLALDIGGNLGYHAMVASVAVGPTGQVHTFEPSDGTFRQMNENLTLNGMTNVIAHKVAVSDKPGTANLFIVGENELGSASLMRKDSSNSSESVEVISFKEISEILEVQEIDLIKIDVEGAENLVIEGMIPYIPQLKNECVIFIEISNGDISVIKPFLDNGFKFREIRNAYKTAFYRGVNVERNGDLADYVLSRSESQLDLAIN